MKVAPLYHALKRERWAIPVIVHTGQHYDLNMSGAFFKDLGLPKPDISLEVGSGTHAEQTGKIMIAYEKILYEQRPDLVVVVGDVNSTIAATLAASKCGVKVAHLEAGLRSFDRSMPEEINRLVTDVLSDILLTPSSDAVENLIKEGIAREKIQLVGNIMIDSLEMLREKIESQDTYLTYGLEKGKYGVVTFHRPSNVDDPITLEKLCLILGEIGEKVPIIFPVHPRTRKRMEESNLLAMTERSGKVILSEPLTYICFMSLVFNSLFVITDSGGIQEETTYLGIPCMTVRENTERPITIFHGTNRLCVPEELPGIIDEICRHSVKRVCNIELWDGNTTKRVVEALKSHCNGSRESDAA